MKHSVNTQVLIRLALLLGLEIVLSRFLSISTPFLKIGFAFVPVAFCAMLYGPFWAAVVGALGDALGANLFPTGPYFPGFTASAFMTGLVFGLCLYKGRSQHWGWIACAVSVNCVGFSLLLNTLWLSMLWGTPYLTLLPLRILQCLLLIPIQTVMLRILGSRRLVLLAKGVPG